MELLLLLLLLLLLPMLLVLVFLLLLAGLGVVLEASSTVFESLRSVLKRLGPS